MTKSTFQRKRIIVGVALIVSLAFVANYYLDLGAFGSSSKKVMIASFAMLALVMHYFGPSIQETREYRDRRSGVATTDDATSSANSISKGTERDSGRGNEKL